MTHFTQYELWIALFVSVIGFFGLFQTFLLWRSRNGGKAAVFIILLALGASVDCLTALPRLILAQDIMFPVLSKAYFWIEKVPDFIALTAGWIYFMKKNDKAS